MNRQWYIRIRTYWTLLHIANTGNSHAHSHHPLSCTATNVDRCCGTRLNGLLPATALQCCPESPLGTACGLSAPSFHAVGAETPPPLAPFPPDVYHSPSEPRLRRTCVSGLSVLPHTAGGGSQRTVPGMAWARLPTVGGYCRSLGHVASHCKGARHMRQCVNLKRQWNSGGR